MLCSVNIFFVACTTVVFCSECVCCGCVLVGCVVGGGCCGWGCGVVGGGVWGGLFSVNFTVDLSFSLSLSI